MDSEKKVTTETTTTENSGDSTSRTEHTEKTVTTNKPEPKPEHRVTEEVTVTEHRESSGE